MEDICFIDIFICCTEFDGYKLLQNKQKSEKSNILAQHDDACPKCGLEFNIICDYDTYYKNCITSHDDDEIRYTCELCNISKFECPCCSKFMKFLGFYAKEKDESRCNNVMSLKSSCLAKHDELGQELNSIDYHEIWSKYPSETYKNPQSIKYYIGDKDIYHFDYSEFLPLTSTAHYPLNHWWKCTSTGTIYCFAEK